MLHMPSCPSASPWSQCSRSCQAVLCLAHPSGLGYMETAQAPLSCLADVKPLHLPSLQLFILPAGSVACHLPANELYNHNSQPTPGLRERERNVLAQATQAGLGVGSHGGWLAKRRGCGYCRAKRQEKTTSISYPPVKHKALWGAVCIDYPHLIDEETAAQRGWAAFQVTQLVRRLNSRTGIWLLVHLMPKPWALEAPWHFMGCPSSGRHPHRGPRHLSFPGNRTESGSASKCPGIHVA